MQKNSVKQISKPDKQVDFTLCITVFLLLALGIVMVLSASAPTALSESGNSYAYVTTQALSAVLGTILMIIISKIDYRIYKKMYKLIYIVCFILLAAVPLIGTEVNGAKRWINLGFTTFQPSEIVKLGLIVFFASFLTDNKDKLKNIWNGFFLPILLLVPMLIILIIFQDHLSVCIVIVGVVSVMMLMAGSKLSHFLTFGVAGVGALGAGLFAMAKLTGKGAFRLTRITSFLDPWADALDSGWQIIQSLYAIGSGGLFGTGLGESRQKYLYISEPQNDFIFSVLAEELGFIGCVAVIVLFAIFIWRGILIAMKAPDTFGSLVAVGITALIGIQVVINIAVVTSSMPVTGMPLPFFSYGGTALMILLCAVRSIIKYI